MIIPGSLLTPGDTDLTCWKIIELDRLDGRPGAERHIFGWVQTEFLWRISSEILEDAQDFVRTKSRRYFKRGPEEEFLSLEAAVNLSDFLACWGMSEQAVQTVLDRVYKPGSFVEKEESDV
jgi:hypothetical protein